MKLNEVKIVSKWKVSVKTDDVIIDVVSSKYDNNKYDFYMNGIKKFFEKDQEQEILNHIIKNIDQHELEYVIANDDYNNIYSVFSIEELVYYFDNDIDLMEETLKSVLYVFIEQEHYEKCKIVNDLLKQIKCL
jgi:hypothetical protein